MERWLAYVHPLWMLCSLALCLAALREGLRVRRLRRARRPLPPGLRDRHLRLGKTAVAALLTGLVLGVVSVAALSDWTPGSSFHALLAGVSGVLFVGVALQGRALERGGERGAWAPRGPGRAGGGPCPRRLRGGLHPPALSCRRQAALRRSSLSG